MSECNEPDSPIRIGKEGVVISYQKGEIESQHTLHVDVKFTKAFILTKKWKNYLKTHFNL